MEEIRQLVEEESASQSQGSTICQKPGGRASRHGRAKKFKKYALENSDGSGKFHFG